MVPLPVIPCGIHAPRGGGERLRGQPRWAGPGGPVPARGPAGAAVMGAAARVTSRRSDTGQVRPGAAVRDASRDGRRGAAAPAGGGIGGPRGGAGGRGTGRAGRGGTPPGVWGPRARRGV